jgi:hypothetical protein
VEESANNRPVDPSVAAREIKSDTELRNMMKLRNTKIRKKETAGK